VDNALDVLWADASIESITITYDEVRFDIVESTGAKVAVVARGHIGFEFHGLWDEEIVEGAEITHGDEFARLCLDLARGRSGAAVSGSPARNQGDFSTLRIRLIDGLDLLCAAAAFDASR
jgi:hypothetical protein